MYICTLPNEHSLENLDQNFERCAEKDPVVIFLDTTKVLDLINEDCIGLESNVFTPTKRLINSERMLDNNEFELPIIMQSMDSVRIYDGRHRTFALHKTGVTIAPYLTAKGMASMIKSKVGASSASTQFDLTKIPYSII